ncbi:MAG: type II and III secretion system family protein [Alphaproteobacteria bacterium]|nr:type II and III secretion system family protein [Alphaproteobacteria bacterium]
MLAGCDLAQNHLKPEREGGMEMQDYRDALAPRLPEKEADARGSALGAPDLQPYIAGPSGQMKSAPLVSISVNQTVPIRDVLFELAEQADYDLELDPRIRGSIIFTARNRPFDEVVGRICNMAGLRYKFEDDVLRVEVDTPYNKLYKISYLSYVRKNKGGIRNDIAVVSGDGADTGSNFESTSTSETDFWAEVDLNLQQILGGAETGVLKTSNDPRITAAAPNPDVQAVAPVDAYGNVTVAPPQAVLNVESLPIDDASSSKNNGGKAEKIEQTFSINKQAGLINVYASEKAHKEIAAYLKDLERLTTAQVLVEAKILEVTLNDQYATGINWRALNLLSGEGALNFMGDGFGILNSVASGDPDVSSVLPGMSVAGNITGNAGFLAGIGGNDFQAVIQAISEFGTVKALASPRMTVLNNQSAILNVATNRIFFEIDIDSSTDEGVTEVDIDSDINNVPEGVLVNVLPSINLDDRTVTMAVRPTVTRIVSTKNDPGVAFVVAGLGGAAAGIESPIPELNVQEIDSVIKVNSGQGIVMGGLLQDRSTAVQSGVPVLGELPAVGTLFRRANNHIEKTELVILLKATILDSPSDSVHNTDKDLYRAFSSDRRPFRL